MWWLLEQSVILTFKKYLEGGVFPTVEQTLEFETMYGLENEDSEQSRVLVIAGNVAQIEITGTLTEAPSYMARYFGGGNTTYGEIISAISQANSNPDVTEIVFVMNSPGGSFSGLFDVVGAIQELEKPTTAKVHNMCASACYAIAAQCDTIEVNNRACLIGSIGVATSIYVDPNEHVITSSEAPEKRPDVTTTEGRKAVVKQLDNIHDLFADALSEGRGVSVDTINTTFGRGALVLANVALERGMIDSISKPKLGIVPVASENLTNIETNKGKNMNLEELKASHPALYAQVVADGKTAGIALERERCAAHLVMGETYGAMKVATEAIKEGSEFTPLVTANYMAAGKNKIDLNSVNSDDNESGEATGGVELTAVEQATADEKIVVNTLNAKYGIPAIA